MVAAASTTSTYVHVRTVDILERQTAEFWKLSNIITGRLAIKITTQAAIDSVNSLDWHLGPHRALSRSVKSLAATIIEGRRIKKAAPATISILQQSGGSK